MHLDPASNPPFLDKMDRPTLDILFFEKAKELGEKAG